MIHNAYCGYLTPLFFSIKNCNFFFIFQINHIDISPNFAGTMISISNFMSNIGASIAPLVIGFILTDVVSYSWPFTVIPFTDRLLGLGAGHVYL